MHGNAWKTFGRVECEGSMRECVGKDVRCVYECVQAEQTRTCATNKHLM